MVERREEVKRPGLRSEGIKGSHWRKEKRSIRSFFWRGRIGKGRGRRRGERKKARSQSGVERKGGDEAAGLGARGGEARATDQEPSSPGTEQVQAASKAFGPEGAARA